jgi:rhodanese-related sulfurtransferase
MYIKDNPSVAANNVRRGLAAGAFLLAWSLSLPLWAADDTLAPAQLLERQHAGHAPLLLDVRHADEYSGGHIDGALNIPVEQLAARHGALGVPRDSDIVVYCQSGRRAAKAQALLQSMGYSHVRLLDGSIQGWQQQSLPLVRETPMHTAPAR